MKELALAKEIAAPPERVWSVITDVDRSAEVISGIKQIERLDGGRGFGVGTTWRETRVMFGREATEVMEVTAVEPGRTYTVEADGHGVHYRSTLTVAATPGGTRLDMTFGGEPNGVFARLMGATVGRLFQGATRKALRQDLDDIAAAAEGAASEH